MGCSSSSATKISSLDSGPTNAEEFQNPEENDPMDPELDSGASFSDGGQQSGSFTDWRDVVSFRSFMAQKGPKQIFEYEFIRSIGRGAQAEVYLVKNTETGESLAAKVYDKAFLYRNNLGDAVKPIQKTVREIQIMSTLKHPNCIGLVEVLDDDYTSSIIIIQPYADKGPLLPQKAHTDPFPEQKAKELFFQICQGVHHIHSNNIVHRDLKPENIMAFSNGKVAIGDFSASVILDDPDGFLEDTDGTPAFYSPEQCTGKPFKGKPTDVWACGVTLYIFLFGHLPFFDVTDSGYFISQFFRIAKQIQNDPVTFDPEIQVSDDAKDLILHCMDKNPETRFTIEQVLHHHWFADLPNYEEEMNNLSNFSKQASSFKLEDEQRQV